MGLEKMEGLIRSLHENSAQNYENSEPLIPPLPDEIAELILLHIPYPYQTLVRSVSRSWNRAITHPSFDLSKKALSLSLPYLFVCASHESTAEIQWQAFDPRSRRWFVLPRMPFPNDSCPSEFACTSLPSQGMLFVLGGKRSDTGTTPVRTTIVYRTSTNQWSLASPMLTARSSFAAGNVNGKIFVAGDKRDGLHDSISTVECYDPENDRWAAVARMRMMLTRYEAAVVGNKWYVTEGWTWPLSFKPRGGVYDADKDTWQRMSEGMLEGWTGGVTVVLGGRLFAMLEHCDCRLKVYVPDDDTWQFVDGERFPSEAVRKPFAVSGVEGMIYVVSRGLHVAIGWVSEAKEGRLRVEWEVVEAPKAFHDFSPFKCQVLYA